MNVEAKKLCRFISVRNHHEKIDFDKLEIPNKKILNIITYSDNKYFDLLEDLIISILNFNENIKITVYDIGIDENNIKKLLTFDKILIKKIERDSNIYITKLKIIIKEYNILEKNDLMLYTDSACKILGNLNRLVNYIDNYDFFSGVTGTPVPVWLKFNKNAFDFYTEKLNNSNYMNYKKDYNLYNLTGIEAGFLGFKKNKLWIDDFIKEIEFLTKNNIKIFDDFPHDQRILSYILHSLVFKKYKKENIILYNSENVRHKWIVNNTKYIAKENMVTYDPGIAKIPYFNYCYHNHIESDNIPPNRQLKNM